MTPSGGVFVTPAVAGYIAFGEADDVGFLGGCSDDRLDGKLYRCLLRGRKTQVGQGDPMLAHTGIVNAP